MDDLLFQYNPWWESHPSLENVKPRERYTHHIRGQLKPGRVVFLSGLRRVGKSTIMKLVANELIGEGCPANQIVYVSLDDYLLRSSTILDVVSSFRQIQKHPVDREITLLLDEVTSVSDFRQQLKTLADRDRVRIVAASSSASLLKDNKAFLTGRSTTVEIQPLTFEEYLGFKGIVVAKRDSHLLDGHFRDFVRTGGMPEHVLHPNREYLMGLVDDIIQKDITAFHGLKNHTVLRDYFTLLMERSGKQVSVNKVARILGISPDTSHRYLGYFEDTYLIHLVSRWGKTNERVLSPKKIYVSDLGIKHLFVGDRDWGSYFENYVYNRIRQYQEVHYVRDGELELDFLTQDGTLVEAKYNTELVGRQRELFDQYVANRKQVISSVKDLPSIEELWEA